MIKKFIAFMVLSVFLCYANFSHAEETKFNFKNIQISQFLDLFFSDFLKKNYILSPDVLADSRMVSVRYDGTIPPNVFLADFLKSLGYRITDNRGINYVNKISTENKKTDLSFESDVFIYKPKFRDSTYLTKILQPLFTGVFADKRGLSLPSGNLPAPLSPSPPSSVVPLPHNGSALGFIDQESDNLVFSGTNLEIKKLEKLLTQLDVPTPQVSVRAVIYEVSHTQHEGTALDIVAKILGGHLGISFSQNSSAGNSVSIKLGGFEAIVNALNSDSRFNVITQPRVLVSSGKTARLTIGQDVPTIGNTTFNGNGQSIQNVVYQNSGVILDVSPTVRSDSIDVRVHQELSNFVPTETGVNNSPTLIKRSLTSSFSAKNNEVVLLGGLSEKKQSSTERNFLIIPLGTTRDDVITDILVFLDVSIV